MTSPSVTFVIPTLNSARTLDACLASVRAQDYDGKVEVLIVEGGSTDATVEIAHRHSVDRIVENPLRTGEAGKAVGMRSASGEILAFVDSDNTLVGDDWLRRMTRPFDDPEVVSSEVLRWDYRPEDGLIDRYCALTGVNDPVSLFIGNYGRFSHLTGTWTGFAVLQFPESDYIRVTVDPDLLPTMGANGYLVRADRLRAVVSGDYLFDIDAVGDLARAGHAVVARVDTAIGHAFVDSYGDFVRKTRRRARDYLYYSHLGSRTYPWMRYRRGIALFVVSTVLTAPLLAQAARGYHRIRDRAWWFHPVACWTTLVVYGLETARAQFRRERLERQGWRQ
jgi:glycosyltransferase involved in cell wall biosynthesis